MAIFHDRKAVIDIRKGTRQIVAIYRGQTRIWEPGYIEHDPETVKYATQGTVYVRVPWWAYYVDVVTLGAGGGGGAGNGSTAASGEGGNAGLWALNRFRINDLPDPSMLAFVIGEHGTGSSSVGGNGTPGKPTYLHDQYAGGPVDGTHVIGGRGGVGGKGSSTVGQSAANHVFHGHTYAGGTGGRYADNSAGGTGGTGSGGGGGGGGIFGVFWYGGDGGNGAAWATFRTRHDVEG